METKLIEKRLMNLLEKLQRISGKLDIILQQNKTIQEEKIDKINELLVEKEKLVGELEHLAENDLEFSKELVEINKCYTKNCALDGKIMGYMIAIDIVKYMTD